MYQDGGAALYRPMYSILYSAEREALYRPLCWVLFGSAGAPLYRPLCSNLLNREAGTVLYCPLL